MGQLELDFDAGRWMTDATADRQAVSRAYVGIDGFLLPMVSDAEAAKRLEKARARRKRLKRRRGVRRPKLKRRRGADQVAAVTDGAEWIAGLVDRNLPRKTTVILDYDHASQHVHQARRAVFGESGPQGQAWADQVLERLSGKPFEQLWQTLVETRSRFKAQGKRKALDELMRYLSQRQEKVNYPAFRVAGLDVGSGPTESMCKSLSRRMKGIGMRWTARNAESMVALEALHQSNLWSAYWSTRLAA